VNFISKVFVISRLIHVACSCCEASVGKVSYEGVHFSSVLDFLKLCLICSVIVLLTIISWWVFALFSRIVQFLCWQMYFNGENSWYVDCRECQYCSGSPDEM